MDPQKIEEMRQEIFSSMDSRLIEILRKVFHNAIILIQLVLGYNVYHFFKF